jgi:hypothetical protein
MHGKDTTELRISSKKISIFAAVVNHFFSVLRQLYMMEKLSGKTNHNKHGVL